MKLGPMLAAGLLLCSGVTLAAAPEVREAREAREAKRTMSFLARELFNSFGQAKFENVEALRRFHVRG